MKHYKVTPILGDPKPKKKGFHSMFMGGKWFSL